MIELIVGSPGSGKSFTGVRLIAREVRKGRPVVTNIPLVDGWEDVLARGPFWRTDERRQQLAFQYRRLVYYREDLRELLKVRLVGEGEDRGAMIVDEAQDWLDSRTWDTGIGESRDEAIHTRQKLNRFFQKHRHLGFRVYLISQHEANIDKRIVRLFEFHTKLRNLRMLRVMGIKIVPFNLFVANTTWNDKVKSRARTEIYTLEKHIAALYHTHALEILDDDDLVVHHPAEAAV